MAVCPAMERPTPAIIARFTHEYELREYLDSEWAARPLELVHERGQTILLLEPPYDGQLDQLSVQATDLGKFLRLSISLSSAVGRLHERGLIYKDIKPSNILVSRAADRIWLTGFGIASRIPREKQHPTPPELIAGTLAYMAPEQTGRMNRSINSRSDLYALGITFYQMLTGMLPFAASDPMECIHCHIARQPVSPADRTPSLPAVISAVVMKLLAKAAEDRYQTAGGLEHDLRRCLASWDETQRIEPFPLGEHDVPGRLLIPEKLYGREREIETLLAAFESVLANGAPELVLVSGYSGIGKSAVVNELHKVLVLPRGLFASGKFDQHKRDIPYATLAQAFQSLIRQLLGQSEDAIAKWRRSLLDALGQNGPLIVELIPELKLIIGEQPPVPEVSPLEAKVRFQRVFRRFIGVFARHEHPLALFLDDLQWLDEATLDLIESLLSQPDVSHLLLIGAYRNNEVGATHPLMLKLETIRKNRAKIRYVVVAPLTEDDLTRLMADTFRCDSKRATPLALLVQAKTAGNPFFAVQFISALVDESLIAFDHRDGQWRWNLDRVEAKDFTDNVVELMTDKLNRLPSATKQVLMQLALLGNSAQTRFLAIIQQDPEDKVHADLWEARRAELVVGSETSYRFAHDRFQEAAYSSIPQELRAVSHLRIGRLLAAHLSSNQREEAIFDIVGQFDRSGELITSLAERAQIADFYFLAGKRAKAAAAYTSALRYLASGAALLADDSWTEQQELAFGLELHSADCEVCAGALQAAEERLATLAHRAVGSGQRCAVAQRRTHLYTMLGSGERAVAVALECLQYVGINWSAHPTDVEARAEYERFWWLLEGRAVEDLVALPLLEDPETLATLDVLTSLVVPALYTAQNLFALSVCRVSNLCLEYGNSDVAPFSYVSMSLVASARFGHYDEANRLGKMACDLVERRGWNHIGGRTFYCFACLLPWTRPLIHAIDPARRAFQLAKEHSDPAFAAIGCRAVNSILLASGHPLDQVEREAEEAFDFIRRFGFFLDRISAPLALVRTLRGRTSKFGVLDDDRFAEQAFEQQATGQPARAFQEFYYWIRKLQARFFAGDYFISNRCSGQSGDVVSDLGIAAALHAGDRRIPLPCRVISRRLVRASAAELVRQASSSGRNAQAGTSGLGNELSAELRGSCNAGRR